MMVASGLALAFDRPQQWVQALSAPAIALGLALVYGFVRLEAPVSAAPLRVGLVTSDSACDSSMSRGVTRR